VSNLRAGISNCERSAQRDPLFDRTVRAVRRVIHDRGAVRVAGSRDHKQQPPGRGADRPSATGLLRDDVRRRERPGCGLGLCYQRTTTLAFTAAGNNSELATATFGVTSGQVLAGVVGPRIEVPVLVGLVYISLALRKRFTPTPV